MERNNDEKIVVLDKEALPAHSYNTQNAANATAGKASLGNL